MTYQQLALKLLPGWTPDDGLILAFVAGLFLLIALVVPLEDN